MYTYVSLRMQQRSVNGSHHKHFSLGGDLQNFAEGQDEDFMEEVIFPDLLEVKAADYKDDQEQIKKQQANIFVPSSSPCPLHTPARAGPRHHHVRPVRGKARLRTEAALRLRGQHSVV